MELLCAFVRNPTKDQENARSTRGDGGSPVPRVLRDDVQAVMDIVVQRHRELKGGAKWGQDRSLDLRGADLTAIDAREGDLSGAMLHGANMAQGKFRNTNLVKIRMEEGVLRGADLSCAKLEGGRFGASDLSAIMANEADFSRCSMTSVNMDKAAAIGAIFSKANISGSRFKNAVLQRAKLDRCHVTNTDFTGASMWRADLSGTKFRTATRVTRSNAGAREETLYCLLTQPQLDEALAHPDNPPEIETGTVDAETGKALVWRGNCITEDQHPEIHGPQQIVKDRNVVTKLGTYVEWTEMGLRLVPGMAERIRLAKADGRWQDVCSLLENRAPTDGWVRVSFFGRADSDVDTCGITRWGDKGRIWILFAYQEGGFSEDNERFIERGPETEERWSEWIDRIDWKRLPIVERRPRRIEDLPAPRQTILGI